MDEPLSNLDAKLRVGHARLARPAAPAARATTVYVTHDQTEAMTLGQRVAVMRDGRVLQVDAPQRLYQQPLDLFVAGVHRLAGDEPRRGGDRRRRRPFGQFRVPLDPARRPAAARGRRSYSASGPRASRTRRSRAVGCRRSRSTSTWSRISAPTRTSSSPSTRRGSRRVARSGGRGRAPAPRRRGPLFTARVDPRTAARVGLGLSARRRSRALPLLRSRHGREPPRAATPRARLGPGPVA